MNQINLSLRAADEPRTIKEKAGVPLFASVFALHNVTKTGGDNPPPPSKRLRIWQGLSSLS